MIKCWAAQPPAQLAEQPAANPADARTDSLREEAPKQRQLQRRK